jgi:cell division protein FtsA
VQQVLRESGYEEVLSSGIVLTGGSALMPGIVELGEDIFLKPVRRGVPKFTGKGAELVSQPRAATVMGMLEEARLARLRGYRGGPGNPLRSVQSKVTNLRDWFINNFWARA